MIEATDSNSVAKTYTWGFDLSGDLQGAGGVGGLLAVTKHNATGNDPYYPSYDTNGNVSEYVDDSDTVVAHYEYSPFGKITSSSGSKSSDFRHRFSTKYLDSETDLYYYGYRYYSNELGRWVNRDPIQERGGWNLYVVVGNSPIGKWDILGNSPSPSSDDISPTPAGERAIDWASKFTEVYGGKLTGVAKGSSPSIAWANSIASSAMTIAYGVMINHLGDKMKAVARKQVFCHWYYSIRFNEANRDYMQWNLIQDAHPDYRKWIRDGLDTGKGGKLDNGRGYRAAVMNNGMLVYMVWSDEPSGEATSAWWSAMRIVPGRKKPYTLGQLISVPVKCCNNRGLVPREK